MKRRLYNLNRNHKGDATDDRTRQERASELRLAEQPLEALNADWTLSREPEDAYYSESCACEECHDSRKRWAGPAEVLAYSDERDRHRDDFFIDYCDRCGASPDQCVDYWHEEGCRSRGQAEILAYVDLALALHSAVSAPDPDLDAQIDALIAARSPADGPLELI